MTIPAGLAAQIGYAAESTYGTRVAPTRFLQFLDEGLNNDIDRLEAFGLRAGQRALRTDRWAAGKKDPGGSIHHHVETKGFGLIFKHCFGAIASTQPNAGSAPTVWEHKATLGDPTGLSLTTQIGIPDITGTVRVFEYEGCKVGSFSLQQELNAPLLLEMAVTAEDETTSQTLASASYPTGVPYFFTQCVCTIAGSPYDVYSAKLTVNNALKEDRYFVGSQLRKQPLPTGVVKPELELVGEFQDLTAYNRVTGGTTAAVTMFWTGAQINASPPLNFAVEITMPAVRFDGDTPDVKGPDVLEQPLKGVALDDGSGGDSPIKLVYRTTDTTP